MTGRVHEAVLELLVGGGTPACTFSAVADRAGVDRSTLYRRYADRWEMIIDAYTAHAASDVTPRLGKSFADDLRSVLRKLRTTLESPLGPALIALAAELRAGSGSDYARGFFERRMAQLDPMFDAAIARGELADDIDREATFSLAAGPLYLRMFIAGRRIDDRFIDFVVDSVCALFVPRHRPKVPLPGLIA